MAPSNLCCAELLADSPSTSEKFARSDVVGSCAAPFQKARVSRKRPLAVLPNKYNGQENTSDLEYYVAPKRQNTDLLNHSRPFVPVDYDKTIHYDNRCLDALLDFERQSLSHFQSHKRHLTNVQKDSMYIVFRNEAVQWLLDICRCETMDVIIFQLAVSYLDRILKSIIVPRENLQAMAAACLSLASKMKAPEPLPARKIIDYMDNSMHSDNLMYFECVVSKTLKWKLGTPTAFEFFDQLMVRAPRPHPALFFHDNFCQLIDAIQLDLTLASLLPSRQTALCISFLTRNTCQQCEFDNLLKKYLKVDSSHIKHYFDSVLSLIEPAPLIEEPFMDSTIRMTEQQFLNQSTYRNVVM